MSEQQTPAIVGPRHAFPACMVPHPQPVRNYRTTDPRAGTRRCCACKATKPLEQFYRDAAGSMGRHHDCKPCHDARRRER